MSATARRFSVMVPVLSKHSTVALASDSTAFTRRMSVWWREMLSAPMLSEIIITSSRP